MIRVSFFLLIKGLYYINDYFCTPVKYWVNKKRYRIQF